MALPVMRRAALWAEGLLALDGLPVDAVWAPMMTGVMTPSLIHRTKAVPLHLLIMVGESPDSHPAGHQRDSQQPAPVAVRIGGTHAVC
ncbi:MAG: hypothetical protein EBS47_08525 [Betaproteobacteria bacterium]|nr:hypothetical protein [Betaproteobacteria bacterium]NBU50125.1 hypothetical protein [Betaproteobacteria bacterium]NBX96246.1 hypothetical protein [Betaproteobacteria bacterium]